MGVGESMGILDKWLTTTFSTPRLSCMSMSKSCINIIYLISLGLVSFIESKNFKAAWSVKTIILLPNK